MKGGITEKKELSRGHRDTEGSMGSRPIFVGSRWGKTIREGGVDNVMERSVEEVYSV